MRPALAPDMSIVFRNPRGACALTWHWRMKASTPRRSRPMLPWWVFMRCRLRGLPLAYGILAARTQSEIPDAADQVFVSALANGKVYIAYGSIRPKVQIAACSAIRAGYNKRAEPGAKTPSSAASPSVPRSNHHSLKRQNRPRRCWRWLWDC